MIRVPCAARASRLVFWFALGVIKNSHSPRRGYRGTTFAIRSFMRMRTCCNSSDLEIILYDQSKYSSEMTHEMSRTGRAAKGFVTSIFQFISQIVVQALLAPIVLRMAGTGNTRRLLRRNAGTGFHCTHRLHRVVDPRAFPGPGKRSG